MRTITNVDAHKRIAELRASVSELVRTHKPTSFEQAMYIAFKLAQKAVDECPKAKLDWREAARVSPKRNGLYLCVVKAQNGKKKVRTIWYVEGEWRGEFEITHWGLMPPLPEEVET